MRLKAVVLTILSAVLIAGGFEASAQRRPGPPGNRPPREQNGPWNPAGRSYRFLIPLPGMSGCYAYMSCAFDRESNAFALTAPGQNGQIPGNYAVKTDGGTTTVDLTINGQPMGSLTSSDGGRDIKGSIMNQDILAMHWPMHLMPIMASQSDEISRRLTSPQGYRFFYELPIQGQRAIVSGKGTFADGKANLSIDSPQMADKFNGNSFTYRVEGDKLILTWVDRNQDYEGQIYNKGTYIEIPFVDDSVIYIMK